MSALAGIPLDRTLLEYVLAPALRSMALGGAVWLLLAVFRVRDISFRLAAWTAVLYAALAMPFLGRLMPEVPVFLPAAQTSAVEMVVAPNASRPAASVASLDNSKVSATVGFNLAAEWTPELMRRSLADQSKARAENEPAGSSRISEYSPWATPGKSISTNVSGASTGIENRNPVSLAAYKTAAPVSKQRRGRAIPWLLLTGVVYCLVAAVLLARFAMGMFLSAKLRREATEIDDEELGLLLDREMREAGVRRAPRLVESASLSVPATLGILRPIILLPTDWRSWNETQTKAVLAHELSHIARRDPQTQWLTALHHAFFWFSPLSWWLDHSIEELAEQASDDDALRAGADRVRYAEVLLDFLATLKMGRGRVRWQAVSMAQGARSKRRLERILAGGRLSRRLGQGAVLAVALGALPLVCLAATLDPTFGPEAQMPLTPAPPPPPANLIEPGGPQVPAALATPATVAPNGPTVPGPVSAPATAPPPPRIAPRPTGPPLAVVAPRIIGIIGERLVVMAPQAFVALRQDWQAAPQSPTAPPSPAAVPALPAPPPQGEFSEYWSYNDDNCGGNQAFVVVSGDRTMSACGSMNEMEHVRKLRGKIHGDFVWFRRDGRSYVIQDPDTVRAAIAAFGPQKELGREQGKLGRQQGELGRQQAELGRRQSEVRITVPDMSAEMARLDAQLRSFDFSSAQVELRRAQEQLAAAQKELEQHNEQDFEQQMRQFQEAVRELDSSATQQMLAHAQSEAALIQSRLGSLQALAGERQAALGQQQAELGQRQAALGRRQAELGRKQAEAARKAMEQVRQLIQRAIARGLAKPE